jgi:MHS family proline/betaine transporter-like MFS transporter
MTAMSQSSTISVDNATLKSQSRKLITANLIGTMLEIYDMSIYGYFAPMIAANFFPASSKAVALLNTLAVFMVSFIVRPIGAVIFGQIGDTIGRKKTLILTILLISFATCAIGVLPNANQIGIWAPILLVVFRIIQGLSFSGEYVGSLIFLMEQAPPHKKGFVASWATCGGNIGLLSASLLCWLVSRYCDPEQLMAWGWRIPFIVAALGGALCLYLRHAVVENIRFEKIKHVKPPLIEVFLTQKKQLFVLLCLTCFYMIVCYLIYVWSTTYLTQLAHISMNKALGINSAALALQVTLIPFLAALSDRIGRKPLLMFGIIGLILAIYPYYLVLQNGNIFWVIFAHLSISFIATFFTSILPIVIAELIPTNVRYSGVGFGYNLAGMLVGGTTPLVAMVLIRKAHGSALLSFYFIFWALLAWAAIWTIKTKLVPAPAAEPELLSFPA